MMILAQALLSTLLFCLPFALLIPLSDKSGNLLYLLFPLFGAIPAVISGLILFAPLEAWLDQRGAGDQANILIPAAGAALPLLLMFAVMARAGLRRMLEGLTGRNAHHGWAGLLVWSLLGAIWGGLWRLSGWLLGL